MFIWAEQKSKLQQGRRIKTQKVGEKKKNVNSAQLKPQCDRKNKQHIFLS